MTVIEVTRTDGGPDQRRRVRVDTAELAPDVAQRVETMLSRLDFQELERQPPQCGAEGGFVYEITVSEGGRERRLCAIERAVDENLEALLELLLHRP